MDYVESNATLSECGTYRYTLTRVWDREKAVMAWCMLNPSTADGNTDDATIRKCVGFAQRWGFGGIVVVNLFGLRSKNPAVLRAHPDPFGPGNFATVMSVATTAKRICVAWGVHGSLHDQGRNVAERLAKAGVEVYALDFAANGEPVHPLYQRWDTQPKLHGAMVRARAEAFAKNPGCTNTGCCFVPWREIGTMGMCQCLSQPGSRQAVERLMTELVTHRNAVELIANYTASLAAVEASGMCGAAIEEHKAIEDALLELGRKILEGRR